MLSSFFFHATATAKIYTLSLHDALPIYLPHTRMTRYGWSDEDLYKVSQYITTKLVEDRKSTRLNSSHGYISYAVFCLKKKIRNKLLLIREVVTRGDFEIERFELTRSQFA